MRDQLGLERARDSQIADRSPVEAATGHRTAVGDPRNSNAFALQLVPRLLPMRCRCPRVVVGGRDELTQPEAKAPT